LIPQQMQRMILDFTCPMAATLLHGINSFKLY
jgi:hypothetical protein